MKKRTLFTLGIISIVLVLGLIWLVPNKPEPLLQGKPESWWVKSLGDYSTTSKQWVSLGTNGIQLLIRSMQNKNGPAHNAYVSIWPHLPVFLNRRLPRPLDLTPIRLRAATMLSEVGDGAKIAVPALVRALDDKDSGVGMNAANSLGFLGKDDKAIMRFFPQALLNTNKWVRGNIVASLDIYQPSADSTAMLLKAMTDMEPEVRTVAALVLLRKDPQAALNAGAVPLLLRCYSGKNKEAADYALNALSQLPPEAVPVLEKTLSDPDLEMREAANKILKVRKPRNANKPVTK